MNLLRTSKQTDAETSKHNWGTLRFFAGAEIDGMKGISAARVIIQKHTQNPRHSHPTCEEVLYLLSGRLTHFVGKEKFEMGPGDSIAIPAGVPHYAINAHDEDADMIVMYSNGTRDFKLEPGE